MEAEKLRELVMEELERIGFSLTETGKLFFCSPRKEVLRRLHRPAVELELAARQGWLRKNLPRYLPYFADGSEIFPDLVEPVLVEVRTEAQHNLFRVARLLWSLPFSKGYGRRLRFLVLDRSNGKLMGILALQSPPLSFPARDRLFSAGSLFSGLPGFWPTLG